MILYLERGKSLVKLPQQTAPTLASTADKAKGSYKLKELQGNPLTLRAFRAAITQFVAMYHEMYNKKLSICN